MTTQTTLCCAIAAVLAAGCLAACRSANRSPQPQPLPAKDGRPALLQPGPRSPRLANYVIDARLDPGRRRIEATETLTWRNSGASAVTALPLHLYMNAFKNETSVLMRESGGKHRSAKASSTGWGWIDITSVSVDGAALTGSLRYRGPDETVAEIELPAPIAAGESVRIELAFTVQLPEVFARTGYKGEFTMVGQWFPKIGVRIGAPGAESWHCEPFHLNSEFFADFGTYDVTLRVPRTHVVAATGVLVSATDEGDTRVLTYRAEDVHDFAWMADPYMEVVSATATIETGQVEVRVYYRPEQRAWAERHLRAGVGAIETFSELFVPYPWPIMSIIDPPPDAASGAGGMEYPTLVTTAADHMLARDGVRLPEFVTVHEVGHNWFQGILASNEVDEAWLDEGVNEYADGLVMEALYGEHSVLDWHGVTADAYQIRSLTGFAPMPSPIATRSYEFADPDDYATASYVKTSLALRTLENIIGHGRFRAAMAAYAEKFAFSHPTGADLFATLEKELGQDLDWYVQPAFYGRGAVDFRVRSVDCTKRHAPRGVFGSSSDRKRVGEQDTPDESGFQCAVLVVNLGSVPAPVDVEVWFNDGTGTRLRWDDLGDWHRFDIETPSEVAEVIIDPDHAIVLDRSPMHSDLRTEARTAASRRAAARTQSWTQLLMQVVGL